MEACKICGEEKANAKGLSYHCSTKHKLKFADYLVKFEYNGKWPTCKCGCGKEVRFFGGAFAEHVQGHQAIGKPKSEETKRKISDTQAGRTYTQERKDRISEGLKADYAAGKTAKIQAMADANRGKEWTEEHRQKMGATRSAKIASGEITINRDAISKSITQKYLDGGFQWSRGEHVSSKTGRKSYYRSSWELRHMLVLDADPRVLSWRYEPFYIEYEWEGKTRRYLPDFIVELADGHRELQEVGVKSVKQLDRQMAKQEAAKRWCAEHGNTSYRLVSF